MLVVLGTRYYLAASLHILDLFVKNLHYKVLLEEMHLGSTLDLVPY